MDPFTHLLTGAALARSGFNRKVAYATAAMVLAADVPDIDSLWSFRGSVPGFEHHRGWTHSFLGLPLDALIAFAIIWLVHRWRLKRGKATIAPVRWAMLYVLCLLAAASHLLLDFTNNYGVRPFFPFHDRWYNAGIVFIFDPVIFGVLLLALVAPPLFALVNSEVGARRQPFRGRGWSVFALLTVVCLWGLRTYERRQAINIAAQDGVPETMRVDANPYPINPFQWQTVTETPAFYRLATVNTLNNSIGDTETVYKPATTLATLAAKRSDLGRVYLDWAAYPIVEDLGTGAPVDDAPVAGQINTVIFGDMRFRYPTPILGRRVANPLGATVLVDQDHHVVDQRMSTVTGVGKR